jgi:hypothetical protein
MLSTLLVTFEHDRILLLGWFSTMWDSWLSDSISIPHTSPCQNCIAEAVIWELWHENIVNRYEEKGGSMEMTTYFWSYFSRMNEERPFTTPLPKMIWNHTVPKFNLRRINIIKYVWWALWVCWLSFIPLQSIMEWT